MNAQFHHLERGRLLSGSAKALNALSSKVPDLNAQHHHSPELSGAMTKGKFSCKYKQRLGDAMNKAMDLKHDVMSSKPNIPCAK